MYRILDPFLIGLKRFDKKAVTGSYLNTLTMRGGFYSTLNPENSVVTGSPLSASYNHMTPLPSRAYKGASY